MPQLPRSLQKDRRVLTTAGRDDACARDEFVESGRIIATASSIEASTPVNVRIFKRDGRLVDVAWATLSRRLSVSAKGSFERASHIDLKLVREFISRLVPHLA